MTQQTNGVQIQIVNDFDELSKMATGIILDLLKRKTQANILVPTGTSPVGVYRLLSKQDAGLFSLATFWNMDEYCVKNDSTYVFVDPDDELSYHRFMREHLLDAQPGITSKFPSLENIDHPGRYDSEIAASGGLDLALNAIGEDGHTFGFNVPASPLDSVTRLVTINEGTQEVNARLTGLETPGFAVSTGIATGMAARRQIVLVSGSRKAKILRSVLFDEISSDVPATILRTHPDTLWIVDQAAAAGLK
jgi:glucosamine-6-phosphate deaminase